MDELEPLDDELEDPDEPKGFLNVESVGFLFAAKFSARSWTVGGNFWNGIRTTRLSLATASFGEHWTVRNGIIEAEDLTEPGNGEDERLSLLISVLRSWLPPLVLSLLLSAAYVSNYVKAYFQFQMIVSVRKVEHWKTILTVAYVFAVRTRINDVCLGFTLSSDDHATSRLRWTSGRRCLDGPTSS